MGFRSTLTVQDSDIKWPVWFVEKYSKYLWFNDNFTGVFSTKNGFKIYDTLAELTKDVQRAITPNSPNVKEIELVFFHECGGVTKCLITKNKIVYSEPIGWQEEKGITHNYCYGCSDVKVI